MQIPTSSGSLLSANQQLSAAESWALRPCPGTYNPHTWNNCQGTYTFPSGEKYTGKFKNGERQTELG